MQFNQSQQAAIETDAKNVVVISGPGSGKTRVLVARLAKLLERGVDPGKITVITYTNAAADEIQQRLVQSADLRRQDAIKKCDERAYEKAEADKDSKLGYCGTLHGWCMKFLRRHAEQVGFAAAITVLDEEQSEALLEQTAAKLRYKGPKGELARCVRAIHELPSSKSPARFVALDYYNAMLGNGMVDFDGILYWTLAALCKGVAEDPVHLLVDEMQDCSRADHMIFNRMAADSRFYLADPDQSIFGFRGGDGRLVDVLARMPSFSVLTLAENYRCAEEICAAANKLIAHNPGRRPKETVSQTGSEGELCMWTNLPSPAHEQAVIAKDIAGHLASPLTESWERDPGEIALILRSNALVDAYAKALEASCIKVKRRKVPTLPAGWSYAKLAINVLANPANDWLAAQLVSRAGAASGNEWEPIFYIQQAALERRSVSDRFLKEFVTGARSLPDKLALIGVAGEAMDRVKAALAAIDGCGSFALADLLVKLAEDEQAAADEGEGVTVCTYHAAKGREWATVYLPAFEQAVIPSERKSADVEEERRLAFVGVTRAKERLVVSCCNVRQVNQWERKPQAARQSQFLAEILEWRNKP